MSAPIKKKIILDATPNVVFDYLTDSKKMQLFADGHAKVSGKVGAKISVFGGWATGKNLEIIPNQKLVQSWIASMPGWPQKEHSTLTITLKAKGKKQTEMKMIHENVPLLVKPLIAQGWDDYFLNPLKEHLRNKPKK